LAFLTIFVTGVYQSEPSVIGEAAELADANVEWTG